MDKGGISRKQHGQSDTDMLQLSAASVSKAWRMVGYRGSFSRHLQQLLACCFRSSIDKDKQPSISSLSHTQLHFHRCRIPSHTSSCPTLCRPRNTARCAPAWSAASSFLVRASAARDAPTVKSSSSWPATTTPFKNALARSLRA